MSETSLTLLKKDILIDRSIERYDNKKVNVFNIFDVIQNEVLNTTETAHQSKLLMDQLRQRNTEVEVLQDQVELLKSKLDKTSLDQIESEIAGQKANIERAKEIQDQRDRLRKIRLQKACILHLETSIIDKLRLLGVDGSTS